MKNNKNDKSVLFCISPHISLIKDCGFNEIQLGSAIVLSVLESLGIGVDSIDLNAETSAYRKNGESVFSSDEIAILSNTFIALKYYRLKDNTREYGSNLKQFVQYLRNSIPKGEYGLIAFSLPWIRQSILPLLVSLNITLMLAYELKKETGARILLGGPVFKKLPPDILQESLRSVTDEYVDYICTGNAGKAFTDLITASCRSSKKRKGMADITIVGNKKLYKPKRLSAHVEKMMPVLTKSKLFNTALKAYKIKKKAVNRSAPDLRQLRLEPSYDVMNRARYGCSIENVFKVSKYLPDMYTEEMRTAFSEPVFLYPFHFVEGCLSECAFCQMTVSCFRTLSPAESVDKIERVLNRYPEARYFRFFNTHLNYSNDFVLKFCDELVKRNIKISFSDSVNMRNPNRDVYQALRAAGCVKLFCGIDSASEKMLKLTNKKLSLERIQKSLEYIHESGIWIAANMITGLPFENEDDHQLNVAFIKDQRDIIDMWVLCRFKLYSIAPFFIDRDKYGIQEADMVFPGADYTFGENGFRSPEKRLLECENRYRELMHVIGEKNDLVFDNDYLLFALYDRLGYTKEKIRSFFDAYYETKAKEEVLPGFSISRGYDHSFLLDYYENEK